MWLQTEVRVSRNNSGEVFWTILFFFILTFYSFLFIFFFYLTSNSSRGCDFLVIGCRSSVGAVSRLTVPSKITEFEPNTEKSEVSFIDFLLFCLLLCSNFFLFLSLDASVRWCYTIGSVSGPWSPMTLKADLLKF